MRGTATTVDVLGEGEGEGSGGSGMSLLGSNWGIIHTQEADYQVASEGSIHVFIGFLLLAVDLR